MSKLLLLSHNYFYIPMFSFKKFAPSISNLILSYTIKFILTRNESSDSNKHKKKNNFSHTRMHTTIQNTQICGSSFSLATSTGKRKSLL